MSSRYEARQAGEFMRSKEQYGGPPNIIGGMPITVNRITFQSYDGLYQAHKWPQRPEMPAFPIG